MDEPVKSPKIPLLLMQPQETNLYYLQSRYYNPQWGRFLNADSFVSTGQGLLGNNMFAYCNNNPIINSDPTGMLLQKDAGGGYFGGYNGGGGGGLALADPASGHIVRPTTPTSIPLFIPYIPPTTTYDLEILRSEIFFIKKDRQEQVVETQIATLTRPDKKPVVFPENPHDFNPQWLIAIERKGTHNGRLIGWFIPFTKIEVFRWDENLNYSNGPHYHIYGMGHFYPGWTVPEPLASWYFSHLQ